ncbi:MAG: aspartate kinase [Gammaproteobacteria bacterium AqS3]|nr:aspartate kinase [Gammaproteobacteria bacterium AqS3]
MRAVCKFGGTSVGSLDRIRAVADIVEERTKKGEQLIVVLSAMAGDTDRLLDMAVQLDAQPNERATDALLSSGECVSTALLAIELTRRGCDAVPLQGWQIGLLTDSAHRRARILDVGASALIARLEAGEIPVITGFQGVDEQLNITTLGRGGSDTSAVALAVAAEADECVIYTDVQGVYTADPRVVERAQPLRTLHYEEMLELSSLGAKVLERRSVEMALKHAVNLRVCSSFVPDDEGTLITAEPADRRMESQFSLPVKNITADVDQAKITLRGVPDRPGLIGEVLGPIGEAGISVDMIVQNIARECTTDITFTVQRTNLERTRSIIETYRDTAWQADSVEYLDSVAKISVIGAGLRDHAGTAAKMFQVLGEAGINIQLVTTSEIYISVSIEERHLEEAQRLLHAAFNLDAIDGEAA